MLHRSLAVLMALGFVFGPDRYAWAVSTELRLKAPAECPNADDMAAGVVDLVGEVASLRGISVEIVRDGQGWRARMSMPDGQRELTGESCTAVADAVVVVVALSIEASTGDAGAPFSPAASADSAHSPVPAPDLGRDATALSATSSLPTTMTADRIKPAGISPVRFAIRAGMLAEVGMLPGPSLGPRLVLALVRGPWSVELGAAALLARRAALGAGGPASDIYWFGGQAALCRGVGAPFTTCLGAESGLLVGTGFGVDQPLTARGAWLAGTASALWRRPVSSSWPLWWELGASTAIAIRRPEFGFDGLGVLHRASAVSGRLLVGLGWQ